VGLSKLIVLGLGSNRSWKSPESDIIDPVSILEKAIADLGKILSSMRRASFFETEPVPKSDQTNFINTAVAGFYSDTPENLLSQIQEIEAKYGRDRSKEIYWGERTLDIDILLFGSLIHSTENLVIPHPRLEERRFALEPLLELWPDSYSPVTGELYRYNINTLPEQWVRKLVF